VVFALPPAEYAAQWEQVLDTAGQRADSRILEADGEIDVAAKSVLVLRAHTPPAERPDHSVAASLAILAQSAGTRTVVRSGDRKRQGA
jgi:glycogen operon protein